MQVNELDEDWYYSRDGEKSGPMSKAELQKCFDQEKFTGNDYVWSVALGSWRTASELLKRTSPLPPPAPPSPRREASSEQLTSPKLGLMEPKKVFKPQFNYSSLESADSITFELKGESKLRQLVYLLAIIPITSIGFLALLLGGIAAGPGGGMASSSFFAICLCAILAVFLLFKFARSKSKKCPIVCDEKAIVVGSNRYELSNVSDLGSSPLGMGGKHCIYIVYGPKQIFLVSGLEPDSAAAICDEIRIFLRRFGYSFGAH